MSLDAAVCDLERYVIDHAKSMFSKQHRDGKQKRKFSLKGSFKIGRGSTQPGNIQHIGKKAHFRKHNFKNTAVNLQPVQEQAGITPHQMGAYVLAKRVIELLDPEFAAGETYLTLSEGIQDVQNMKITGSYEDWRYPMVWQTLYFSIAVWISLAMVWFPFRMRQQGSEATQSRR